MKNRKLITEVFDGLHINYDIGRNYIDDDFTNVECAIDLIIEREIVRRLLDAKSKLIHLHDSSITGPM